MLFLFSFFILVCGLQTTDHKSYVSILICNVFANPSSAIPKVDLLLQCPSSFHVATDFPASGILPRRPQKTICTLMFFRHSNMMHNLQQNKTVVQRQRRSPPALAVLFCMDENRARGKHWSSLSSWESSWVSQKHHGASSNSFSKLYEINPAVVKVISLDHIYNKDISESHKILISTEDPLLCSSSLNILKHCAGVHSLRKFYFTPQTLLKKFLSQPWIIFQFLFNANFKNLFYSVSTCYSSKKLAWH